MKSLFKLSQGKAVLAGLLTTIMSFTALAADFDFEGVVVDGIKYGIIGTEAPYEAYVVQTDMFDDDFEYEGEVIIPETIEFETGKIATVTGIDNSAFYGSSVTSVTIPNSVLIIGKQAFGVCGSLSTVKIGNGIKEIMSKAFFPDANLVTMFITAPEPPAIATDALMNAPEKMTLYVPADAVESYKNADTWKKVGNIVAQDDFVKVTEIIVTPATANVMEMGTVTLSATVYPENAEQTIKWMSSDTNVATVSNTGEVFGKKNGVCTIYACATDGSDIKGECLVTVGSGKVLEVNTPFVNGYPGEEVSLSATVYPEDATIEWEVKDTDIAEVNANGSSAVVKLISAGTTVLSVSSSNGLTVEIDITVKELVKLTAIEVTPSVIECEVGDRIYLSEFTITPVPENASDFNPIIEIEDSSIVGYDLDDYDLETFECLAPGTTRLIWSQGDIQGWCTIVVAGEEVMLTDIILDPSSVTGAYSAGDQIKITATPVPADATDFMPIWSSSDNNVAIVDNEGLVTVVSPSKDVTITCTSDKVSAQCTIYFSTVGVEMTGSSAADYQIMSIDGVILKGNASSADLDTLLPGIYIVNGKKIIKK